MLAAAEAGEAEVALVASSASERQKGGTFLSSFSAFDERRKGLGFGALPCLPSIARSGISFFGNSIVGGAEIVARERAICLALFPTSPFGWRDYAAAKGHSHEDTDGRGFARWRNQLLNAQAFWAHEYAGQDVFVTSDARFKVLERHPDFPVAVVNTPCEAIALL